MIKVNKKVVKQLSTKSFKVGILETLGRKPKIGRSYGYSFVSNESVETVAIYLNEVRPFLSTFADKNKSKIDRVLTESVSLNKLKLAILKLTPLMKNYIIRGSWKQNTIKTIESKRSSKPLVNTGQLLNSISTEGGK